MIFAFILAAAGTLPVAETQANAVARWLDAPAQLQVLKGTAAEAYDPTVSDPGLSLRVRTAAGAQFEFEAKGPHLVELFIEAADG